MRHLAYQKIVNEWNQTEKNYPNDKTVPQLFEEQILRTPDNIAIVFEEQELTYKELNKKANRLARYIESKKPAYKRVVFLLDRTEKYLISILGVWKAGCAFIPLKPDQPLVKHISVTEPFEFDFIITTQKHFELACQITSKEKLILLESDELKQFDTKNPRIKSLPNDLAYIIFTSGSTGRPKGAMVHHRGMLNHLCAKINDFSINENDKVAQTAAQTFDVSVWQFLTAILVGGKTVVLSDENAWVPAKLFNSIDKYSITVFESVPSHMAILLEELEKSKEQHILESLKWFIMNGEGLPPGFCVRWFKLYPDIPMANVYGPTECSDDVTHYKFSSVPINHGTYIPIGKPIQNSKHYVLDHTLKPVPVKTVGELYVSGDCVGLGYINNEEKTAESFISNPFQTAQEKEEHKNDKLYKTGDLVRWLPDGNLDYIGRKDSQVKISGQRVELGEIEETIKKINHISNAAVLAYDNNTKLHSVIELNKNDFKVYDKNGSALYLYTLEQRPELKKNFVNIHLELWPEYFFFDENENKNWAELYNKYLGYQFVLVNDQDAIVSVCNTIPICWNGKHENLPKNWSEIFENGLFADEEKLNTLFFLAATIPSAHRGQGLAEAFTNGVMHLAFSNKLDRVIVALRPLGKSRFPSMSLEEYCNRKTKGGYFKDPWLRANEKIGENFLACINNSQRITAPINMWEKWLNKKIANSGVYIDKQFLNEINIDIEKGIGEYIEPCVLFEYQYNGDEKKIPFFITSEFIKENLSVLLPEYMIPQNIRIMHSLPLNTSGKLDRKALPKPEITNDGLYLAPTTDHEIKLCNIWQEVLSLEKVGILDDFFKIGGNSLLAIRLVSLVNLKFRSQLSVEDIFKSKTIVALAEAIQKSSGGFIYRDYLITSGYTNENDVFGLTNAQQAYLYGRLDSFEMGNISTHSYSELNFNKFDVVKFEKAFNCLIQRHGALRTIFKDESQCILPNVSYYKITQHGRIGQSELQVIRNRLSHKIYQANQWPLFDFELSQFEDHFILHISYDLLIMDGTSMLLLFDELAQLYNARNEKHVELPQLKINFRDYILKYNEVRSSKLYTEAKQYWIDKLYDYNFDAKLPMVVSPGSINQPKFARLTKTIPLSKWNKIKDKAQRYNISLTPVILYAYGQVLTRWCGQSNFCVNLTLFNRLPLHEQVNDIVGDFTVLELFNFERGIYKNIHSSIQGIHSKLWKDVDHNLFDGIDFQRLIRRTLDLPQNQSLSPVVLTSFLGKSFN